MADIENEKKTIKLDKLIHIDLNDSNILKSLEVQYDEKQRHVWPNLVTEQCTVAEPNQVMASPTHWYVCIEMFPIKISRVRKTILQSIKT